MNRSTLPTLLLLTALPCQTAAFVAAPTIPLGGTLVHDPDRQVTVVFETGSQRMWEWDGATFRLRLGAVTPQSLGACLWDPARHGIVAANGACWDGANWSTIGIPTGWSLGAMAYDEHLQRLVRLFSSGTPDAAEWDGVQWHRISPPASPGYGGSLVYDPTRGTCVLAIGSPLVLWTWDGSQWQLLDGNGPALASTALRYDPGHQRLVACGTQGLPAVAATFAYGAGGWTAIPTPATFSTYSWSIGYDGFGILRLPATTVGDGLWRLEGTVWRQLAVECPQVRADAAIASWPSRPGILMFGGGVGTGSNSQLLADTWVRDGTWSRRQPAHAPAPRRSAGLAWSPNNQAFVLYGGLGAASAVFTDTWLWNGSDWLQQSPATSPAEALLLVTDPAGGVLGLHRRTIGTTNDQWQWNGTAWNNTPGHGAAYTGAAVRAGYDPHRNVVTAAVEYGWWEWDGAVWTQRGTTPVYPAGSITYRPDTQRMLIAESYSLGEWDGTTWTSYSVSYPGLSSTPWFAADFARNRLFSLWHNQGGSGAWNGVDAVLTATPASASRFGYGCAIGPSPGLLTDGSPGPGEAGFGIVAQTFAPHAPCVLALGFQQQGTHLGGGCVAWLAQPPAVHFLLADAAGRTRFPLAIPNDASLNGTTILTQLGALDPARSPLGSFTLTDGLRFTIGD